MRSRQKQERRRHDRLHRPNIGSERAGTGFLNESAQMTRYLIDIRMMGSVKQQIRGLRDQLQEKFSLGNKLVVPHITLAGPFSTANEEKLVEDFTRVCTDQKEIPRYEVGGYGFFDDSRVVFVTITPDGTLKQFRYQLSRAISPYCSLRSYDLDSSDAFRFHATLAMKLDWLTFQRMKWYFRMQEPVIYRHHPIRATLIRNAKILCEYDFIQERMLSRAQALSRATMKRDFAILKLWDDRSCIE
jgi:2'-5' RNA ligase